MGTALRWCLVTLLFSTVCNGQKIEVEKTFWQPYKITLNAERLSLKEVIELSNDGTLANHYFTKARANYTISAIAYLSGGLLTGYAAGQELWGDRSQWGFAIPGVGLGVLGFILEKSAYKKLKLGAKTYNEQLQPDSTQYASRKGEIIVDGKGIGLKISF